MESGQIRRPVPLPEHPFSEKFRLSTIPLAFAGLSTVIIFMNVAVIIISAGKFGSGNSGGSAPEDSVTRMGQVIIGDLVFRIVMVAHCLHKALVFQSKSNEKIAKFLAGFRFRSMRMAEEDPRATENGQGLIVIMDAEARANITDIILFRVYAAWVIVCQFLYFFSVNAWQANTTIFAAATVIIVVWLITGIVFGAFTLKWTLRKFLEDYRRKKAIRALRDRFRDRSGPVTVNPRVIELGPARSMFRAPPVEGEVGSEDVGGVGGKLSAYLSKGWYWREKIGTAQGTLAVPESLSLDHLDTEVLMAFAALPVRSYSKEANGGETNAEDAGKEVRKKPSQEDKKPLTKSSTPPPHSEEDDTDSTRKRSKSAASSDGHSTCAVCMSDYDEGDKIRQLKCGHEYHMQCIDPWVLSKPPSSSLGTQQITITPRSSIQGSDVDRTATNASSSSSAPQVTIPVSPTLTSPLATGMIRKCPLCGLDPITGASVSMKSPTSPPSHTPGSSAGRGRGMAPARTDRLLAGRRKEYAFQQPPTPVQAPASPKEDDEGFFNASDL
ncbi:hypothetical protein HDU97_007386 [Phlyctochytrium planicorne]|nr:hypothetical protein HDU97_007386 [Phlyctochytrium planicorne]